MKGPCGKEATWSDGVALPSQEPDLFQAASPTPTPDISALALTVLFSGHSTSLTLKSVYALPVYFVA